MRVRARALVLAAVAACGGEAEPGRLRVTAVQGPGDSTADTIQFEAVALAHPCGAGAGLLLTGTRAGSGALLWLRTGGGALAGSYDVLPRGDSSAARGAIVAARLKLRESARGVALDSGRVTAVARDGRWDVRARGAGLGVPGARRTALEATFEGVAPEAETVACRTQR